MIGLFITVCVMPQLKDAEMYSNYVFMHFISLSIVSASHAGKYPECTTTYYLNHNKHSNEKTDRENKSNHDEMITSSI